MAIEDGATLAACLLAAGTGDPAETLRHYERLRLPRVTRLQEISRANKTRFHMRDGSAQQARDAEWATAGDRSPDTLRWLYDLSRPPRSVARDQNLGFPLITYSPDRGTWRDASAKSGRAEISN